MINWITIVNNKTAIKNKMEAFKLIQIALFKKECVKRKMFHVISCSLNKNTLWTNQKGFTLFFHSVTDNIHDWTREISCLLSRHLQNFLSLTLT